MSKIRPAVKTHGGKFYLAAWIVENFPESYETMTYCEPFCAGASVFLNKNPSPEEVLCDIDDGIICVLKALRDEPKEFINRIKRIKYSDRSFKLALNKTEFKDYIDQGINEYVLRRMSRGGLKKAFAWSERLRGGKPGDMNAWQTMIKELPTIANRLKNTSIFCQDFIGVIKTWDEENTLFYLDPPYLHSTRNESATDTYEHEMTVEDHMNLLHLAKNARGKIAISGYSSPLYNRTLKNWRCKKRNVANHSGQNKVKEKRVEFLWMNY